MQKNTEIKTLLIIGGSTGIGNHLAQQLAVKHRVYATYNKHTTIPPENERLSFHFCNVIDEETDRLLEEAIKRQLRK